MEFCGVVQLTTSQIIGSISSKTMDLHKENIHEKLIIVSVSKAKSFSDVFFMLFEKLKGNNGLCFSTIQEDSFWFFFSLLKLSLGYHFDDELERNQFRLQLFTFFESLTESGSNLHLVSLKYIVLKEKRDSTNDSQIKSIFHEILMSDRFEEFYNLCSDYLTQDLKIMFVCVHHLLSGRNNFLNS